MLPWNPKIYKGKIADGVVDDTRARPFWLSHMYARHENADALKLVVGKASNARRDAR